MNQLQGFRSSERYPVTLNPPSAIASSRIIRTIRYEHPIYSSDALAAQHRHADVSAVQRTHYCGAYWRYGFHEDGVVSALKVAAHFGASL